jgi:hypothetical protein
MAKVVMLRHRESGIIRRGFYGFSWTTLFFGFFPALFRGDFLSFIGGFAVIVILGVMTFGIGSCLAMFVWAFFYNRYYTQKLIERGYALDSSGFAEMQARRRLGLAA